MIERSLQRTYAVLIRELAARTRFRILLLNFNLAGRPLPYIVRQVFLKKTAAGRKAILHPRCWLKRGLAGFLKCQKRQSPEKSWLVGKNMTETITFYCV